MGGSEAKPYHLFSLWVGSEALPPLFLMGGQTAKQSLTPPFPYGWAAGRRGAIYNVLEIRF